MDKQEKRFPSETPVAGISEVDGKTPVMVAVKEGIKQLPLERFKDYVELTGIELEPIASGALPTPLAGQTRTMDIVGPPADVNGNPQTSTWTHATLPGGKAELTTGKKGKLFFSNGEWRLTNVQDLPKPPVKNEFGQSTEDPASQMLVTILKEDFDSKIKLVTNAEFLYALVDKNEALLWGKRRDGTTYDCDLSIYNYTDSQIEDVKKLISELSLSVEFIKNDYLPKSAVKNERGNSTTDTIAQKLFTDFADSYDNKISLVTNSEYLYAIVDKNNILLWGKRRDGSTYDCDNDIPQKLDVLKSEVAITNIKTITNAEYLYAIVTKDNVLLWGKRRDGSTYDSDTTIINEISTLQSKVTSLDTKISVVSNDEFLYAIVDNNGTLLWGKRRDGSTYDIDVTLSADVVKLKERLSFYDSTVSVISNDEYIWAIVDKNNKMIEGITKYGYKHILKSAIDDLEVQKLKLSKEALTQLQQDLKSSGFKSGAGDWSDDKNFRLPISSVPAKINLIIDRLPTTKTNDFKGFMEYWDYEGNYFKKPIVLNAQGSSSLSYDKKNFTLDLDDGSKIKFGTWVEQDSWHLKAHYTDALKVNNNTAYDIFEHLANERPYGDSRVWDYELKKGQTATHGSGIFKNDYDTGARGFPDGFPCSVYHNGDFYGIYFFNLKKHRDNYKMDRGNVNHIHLDGTIGAETMFNGVIDWTQFEIRNPNPRLAQEGWELLDINGNKYDGDNPKELSNQGNSGLVKQAIIRLANSVIDIKANPTAQKFETYFVNKWMFSDYLIVANKLGNGDAFNKNWQWLTYDSTLWSITPYDWDGGIGVDHIGNYMGAPSTGLFGTGTETPMKYFWQIYQPDIKSRYQELNNSSLSLHNLFNFYKNRINWIGYENFSKENKKWANMPGYRPSTINPKWRLKNNVVVSSAINYNPTTTYQANQEVVYGTGNERYIFIAKEEVTGVAPLDKFYDLYPKTLGFYNSELRIYKWLEARNEITNNLFK